MLFKIALVLLVLWLLVVVVVYAWGIDNVSKLIHIPLFIGLMLLPIAFMRARDAAQRADDSPPRP